MNTKQKEVFNKIVSSLKYKSYIAIEDNCIILKLLDSVDLQYSIMKHLDVYNASVPTDENMFILFNPIKNVGMITLIFVF